MNGRRTLLLAALGLAGAVRAAPPPEPLPRFTVEISDGVFTPKRLTIPAGRRVRIDLVNHGPGALEFENAEMNIERVLGAGGRSFVVLPALAPGVYEFVDEFNPMTGILHIEAR